MNRGYEGRPIFRSKSDKSVFLELLEKIQMLMKIRVLAYCVMDNHYHLVVQNQSGKMSDFFKQLNGQYAVYYRKVHGGRGYVFQDRYKTMLIQDDVYLQVAIAYVLNNSVLAGLSSTFSDYPWSSGSLYFRKDESRGVDSAFVEELFGSKEELDRFVNANNMDRLPTVRCELGWIIGGEDFVPKALEMAERRSGRESVERRRIHDMYFEPVVKVLNEFEEMRKVKIEEIDVMTYPGKRLRADLLVQLKERAGMTYREIARMDLFAGLEINSLGGIYRQVRHRRSVSE